VWFIIADGFALGDLSIRWDVFQRGEETCVGSGDVSNALEQAPAFVAKTSGPKWLETGILHKSRLFHFFAGGWVNDCVGMVPL
jgi:hypothetical protein